MRGREDRYRGRLAPTPSGLLHVGHARTFFAAWNRAQEAGGTLIFRTEDIDRARCRAEFEEAAVLDLRWLGIEWDEGGGLDGPHGPYRQSERFSFYESALRELALKGQVYPSSHSRKEIAESASENEQDGSWMFPPNLRVTPGKASFFDGSNWRFRVPDGERVEFIDERRGPCSFVAGRDFGDFLVWRKDGSPSYELAVVIDDAAMRITEVVRGEDLLLSTARQLLLYGALGLKAPRFCHEPLVCDVFGKRLSKTIGSLAIRELRSRGLSPEQVLRYQPD